MNINEIILNGFRNYKNQRIVFEKGINLFVGNNAQGKTNIIEAIYITAFGKSYRTNRDIELINFDREHSRIEMIFNKKEIIEKCEYFIDRIGNKLIKFDGIKINKFSDIIGKVLVVIFSPEDLNIVKGSPSSRRKFLDMICCQISKNYLINFQEYNKLLKIKNNILKKGFNNENVKYLETINEKMSDNIYYISNFRNEIINELLKYSKDIHRKLTNNLEEIEFEYLSDYKFLQKVEIYKKLNEGLKVDFFRKVTNYGIQRDDILFKINDLELIKYGSQGQNRTVLLTLKLANFEIIKQLTNEYPILLLDDIMSELDSSRINFLLEYIKDYQSIITTTEDEFLYNKSGIKIFKIINGCLQI